MRGADLVAGTLAAANVQTVFALSGNQIMPLFDAAIDGGQRLIHVRHEAAAVAMADAFAQVTGEVGVALVTAGPGFANALSALLAARAAESPVVLLSGDSPLAMDGRGAFQELDQVSVATPIAKASRRATSAATLGHEIAWAIRTARSGRPGPVHLALPFDLLDAAAAGVAPPAASSFSPDRSPIDAGDLGALAAALAAAARPLVLTGPALNPSRAGALLGALAEAIDAPVAALESPRGLRDPALGAFAEVLAAADLVLSLGKAIDHTLAFARPPAVAATCPVLVIDPDALMLERARRQLGPRLVQACRADADHTARALIGHASSPPTKGRAAWRADVAAAIAWRGAASPPPASGRILPQALGQAVQKVLDQAADPILVADGGEFGQWAQATCSAPTRVINGPLGAIGNSLGHAIAAKLARPDATVIAMMGDGTIGFHLSELETAVRYRVPLVAVIGHDARWNAEHQIQLRDYGADRLIGCELAATRYDLAAVGLGAHGEHVTTAGDLAPALARAVASDRPACVNVAIEGQPAPTFSRPATMGGR